MQNRRFRTVDILCLLLAIGSSDSDVSSEAEAWLESVPRDEAEQLLEELESRPRRPVEAPLFEAAEVALGQQVWG